MSDKLKEAETEILELLNDGESGQALKEFRRLHGMVNMLKCQKCGLISTSARISGPCAKCDSWQGFDIVIVKDENEALI